MSDSDGDFSDELLELAGAGEKRRKRGSKPNAKRRKADAPVESESENDYESEEDDSMPSYPLEGKFIDEADKQRLMHMHEIEREDILAQRLEELQRLQDKRNLENMLRAQQNGDSVSKAAKRQHAVRGATKEKSRKLDELKAKRKAKSEKKRTKASSPKRERSSSPMDMEMSSEDEEDGQITKFEQEEERETRLLNKARPKDEELTLADLESCRISRDLLCRYSKMPWFEDYVKEGWVRYLIGSNTGGNVYRACEITNLGANPVKPYKIENDYYEQTLELRFGKAVKAWPLDRVSNAPFTADEFEKLMATCKAEQVKLPAKRALEKKHAQLQKLPQQQLTEADVAGMIERKNALRESQAGADKAKKARQRFRLLQARTLAEKRRDFAEVAELEAQIKELNDPDKEPAPVEAEDLLASINERNRKANMEAVRKAEAAEADRKRRERMLKMTNGGGTPRPGTPLDSARLKAAGVSRTNSPNGTPRLAASGPDARSVSPMPGLDLSALQQKGGPKGNKRTFESIVASAVDIDLGDF